MIVSQKRLCAYTLTEIVIVMLVIAVVVAVSLKITKAKFDSVIKYTYYSAYDLLSSVTGEMITDSDLSEQYGDLSFNFPSSSNKDMFFKTANLFPQPRFAVNDVKDKFSGYLRDMFMQKACAYDVSSACSPMSDESRYNSSKCGVINSGSWCGTQTVEALVYSVGCFACCHPLDDTDPTNPDGGDSGGGSGGGSTGGYACYPRQDPSTKQYYRTDCPGQTDTVYYPNKCNVVNFGFREDTCGHFVRDCAGGTTVDYPWNCPVDCPNTDGWHLIMNGEHCVKTCSDGSYIVYGLQSTCPSPDCAADEEYDSATNSCVKKNNCAEGEIWDSDLNSCRVPQTADDCTATQVYDKDKQMCREKNITIPQAGNDFCEAFAGMTNTVAVNCTGKNTTNVKSAVESGDFSELEPDIVLRNGMRLYNLKNPAVLIKKLEGNESVAILSKSEIKVSLKEKMYMVWNNLALKISYLIHNLLEQPAYAICASMHSTDGSCPGYWCEASEHKEGTGCFRCCTPKPSTGGGCTPPSCSSGYILDKSLGKCGQCVKDTSCTPPTCDEGYELDTTKGECGECAKIKDTDDKDSPEITVPTLDGLNEKGYIVYVDIDGERGDSILYEDVYPFYITFSGLVIPAFERGKEAGGNSKAHLAVSVKYDTYDSTRKINWMTPKSTDFQHAACMSKYVTATNYCTGVVDNDLSSKQSICSNKESDCRIVPNKPLKF